MPRRVDRCHTTMTLDTQSIDLAEITIAEFNHRKDFWKRSKLVLDSHTLYAALDSPFSFPLVSTDPVQDYVALFNMVFSWYDLKPMLCVRAPSGWCRNIKKQVDDNDILKLAQTAAADKFKQNYLEVKLLDQAIDPVVRARFPWNRPTIEFTESEVEGIKSLVGYQLSLPVEYKHLFSVNAPNLDSRFTLIHGIWMPEQRY
ncbi:MAG: hypothetical protein Q7K45_00870 [Nanoarchaeota archaeon]|nr:hypothetical protein [Nanoarchaeota archaeon]